MGPQARSPQASGVFLRAACQSIQIASTRASATTTLQRQLQRSMPRADQRMVVAATAAVLAWLQTAALLTLGAEITIAPTRAACPGGSASPKHMVVVNAGGVPASLHYSWAACNDPAMGGKGHSTEQASANARFDGCVCVCVCVCVCM